MSHAIKDIFKKIPGAEAAVNRVQAGALRLLFRAAGGLRYSRRIYTPELEMALQGSAVQSDISDHLGQLFFVAASAKPKLIVELGTRGGESTRALLAAAEVADAKLLSVDIDPCGALDLPYSERWSFVQADDIEYGKSGFVPWCKKNGIESKIDVLFIDTSHEYQHSVEEIAVWSGHLNDDGVMMFHDTNMGKGRYARLHGSIGFGWDNGRGVIRAIEESVGRKYDERAYFIDRAAGFLIYHYPHCNGFTVMKRFD